MSTHMYIYTYINKQIHKCIYIYIHTCKLYKGMHILLLPGCSSLCVAVSFPPLIYDLSY